MTYIYFCPMHTSKSDPTSAKHYFYVRSQITGNIPELKDSWFHYIHLPSACNDLLRNKEVLSTEVSGKWRGQLGRANSVIHTYKILNKTLIAKDQNTEKSKYLLKWNHCFDSSFKRSWKEKHKQVIELILWAQRSKWPRVTFQESFFFHIDTSCFEKTNIFLLPLSRKFKRNTFQVGKQNWVFLGF